MAKIPDDLEAQLKKIIADVGEIDIKDITPEAQFVKDLGMDSIRTLELLVAMEQKFKIKIREEDMVKITNLKDSVKLAKKLIGEKNNSTIK